MYFAASTDALETNRRFAKELELDFPILSDTKKEVADSYGVLRRVVGIAARHTFYIGKDGRILAIDRHVDPATHGAAVARKLEELAVARRR
jgi:thioredoxin-dependent peroxiredoxin